MSVDIFICSRILGPTMLKALCHLVGIQTQIGDHCPYETPIIKATKWDRDANANFYYQKEVISLSMVVSRKVLSDWHSKASVWSSAVLEEGVGEEGNKEARVASRTHTRGSMPTWRSTRQFWRSWCQQVELRRGRQKPDQGMSRMSWSRMSALTCRWWGATEGFEPLRRDF